MMTKISTLTAVVFLLTVASTFATQTSIVQGEYLEARSASVYIGACHYGSEFVEGGKEATLVWNIHRGSWNGVSLDGLTVVAVVSAQDNLAIDTTTRRSVLYLDANATQEQRAALTDLIVAKRGSIVGKVVHTQVAPITFTKQDAQYDLRVSNVLTLSVSRYACQSCTQPHQIWYEPLEQIDTAIVGKSTAYRYQDKILSVTWNQGEATNNAFVGNFAM
ncbi:MAG: DUF1326 domain-containing protein [Candidatus Poribacteria bacterium]|nr:DUF1326 domain-containing protein [Candidatus Poribacteria bacterium]